MSEKPIADGSRNGLKSGLGRSQPWATALNVCFQLSAEIKCCNKVEMSLAQLKCHSAASLGA